jgi:hypothetical protein
LVAVVLEAHNLKLTQLQDQFQHLHVLHQQVVEVEVQVVVQVLNQILMVQQVEVVVEDLVDVVILLLD